MKTIKAQERDDQPVTQRVLNQAIDQGRKRATNVSTSKPPRRGGLW